MFGCRSHHKSNQHAVAWFLPGQAHRRAVCRAVQLFQGAIRYARCGLRPSRNSTLSSRQGRAECRRAYGNISLLDPSASRQQVSLLEVRGRSRRRTRMPLRLRFRAEACYGHGLSTLSSWALSRRLQNSARGWMFRSNGLQENHISPQVDCRMCGPDRRHLVRCVRNVGRTAVPPQRMHLHSASRSSSVLPWCIWHLEIFLSDRATPTSALALNGQDLEARCRL